jgi:hypothetical protein
VGVNAWERRGANVTVWRREKEDNCWEKRGLNTLRSGTTTATFKNPEPPG